MALRFQEKLLQGYHQTREFTDVLQRRATVGRHPLSELQQKRERGANGKRIAKSQNAASAATQDLPSSRAEIRCVGWLLQVCLIIFEV